MKRKWAVLLMTVWVVKGFMSIDSLVSFLNLLPPDSAVGAKTLTLGAQRAFVGTLTTPYYLIFQTDHPENYRTDSQGNGRSNIE